MKLFDVHYLFASFFWGTLGVGYFMYGRKQREPAPFVGGLAMVAVSWFVGSVLLMSLICLALMVGVYVVVKRWS